MLTILDGKRPDYCCQACLGLVLMGLALPLGAAATPDPQVVFEPAEMDLGTLRTGGVLTRRIQVHNTSCEPVQVLEARGGCGCVRPRLQPAVLAPGARLEIPFDIHTLGAAPGMNFWRIHVTCRQGVQQFVISALLRAHVVQDILVQPPELTLYLDGPWTGAVVVRDRRTAPGTPLHLCAADTTSSRLRVAGTRPLEQPGSWLIRITVPDIAPGDYEEGLLLYTDDRDYSQLRVPVTIHKRALARWSILPRQVELVVTAGGIAPARLVTIRDRHGGTVQIRRAEAHHPAIACQFDSTPSTLTVLKVSVRPQFVDGDRLDTHVTVYLDDDPQGVLIPVTVLVRR